MKNDAIIDELLTNLEENEFEFDENDNTFTVNSKSNNESTIANEKRRFSKLSQETMTLFHFEIYMQFRLLKNCINTFSILLNVYSSNICIFFEYTSQKECTIYSAV